MTSRCPFAAAGVAAIALGGCTNFHDGWQPCRGGPHTDARTAWQPLAELGNPRAQYFLGLIHESGYGVPRDPAEAARWYRMAADQSHPSAQRRLELMEADGWELAARDGTMK